MENDDEIEWAARIATHQDCCIHCRDKSIKRRRYSTSTPSFNICRGCGKKIYEIHRTCLDCSDQKDACPWCERSPWVKQNENEVVSASEESGSPAS
jgi:hypothetical protein